MSCTWSRGHRVVSGQAAALEDRRQDEAERCTTPLVSCGNEEAAGGVRAAVEQVDSVLRAPTTNHIPRLHPEPRDEPIRAAHSASHEAKTLAHQIFARGKTFGFVPPSAEVSSAPVRRPIAGSIHPDLISLDGGRQSGGWNRSIDRNKSSCCPSQPETARAFCRSAVRSEIGSVRCDTGARCPALTLTCSVRSCQLTLFRFNEPRGVTNHCGTCCHTAVSPRAQVRTR